MAMAKKGPGGLGDAIGGAMPAMGDDMGAEAKKAAVSDLMSALKKDDVDAATAAFKRAYDACAMGSDEPEEY